jgi:hypothetical protein
VGASSQSGLAFFGRSSSNRTTTTTEHGPFDPNDWYAIQISKVLPVFGHAFLSHAGIVSFLDAPTDHERARRVIVRLVDPAQANSSI